MQLGPDKRREIAPAELVVDDPELSVVPVKELFVRCRKRDIAGRADFVTVIRTL